MSKQKIDINCDLGEGQFLEDCARDALLMPYISRCNIACGGHAGNALTMQQTLRNANHFGLLCGAHPGYPDKESFGRVSIDIPLNQLLTNLRVQIGELTQHAQEQGVTLTHIKLHGALYNDAEQSTELAAGICQCLAEHFPRLAVLGLPQGAMQKAACSFGLVFLREAFLDRAYLADGNLVPRKRAGGVYQDVEQCIAQAVAIVRGEKINTLDKLHLHVVADTLCLHGDSPIALPLASTLQIKLRQLGYSIK